MSATGTGRLLACQTRAGSMMRTGWPASSLISKVMSFGSSSPPAITMAASRPRSSSSSATSPSRHSSCPDDASGSERNVVASARSALAASKLRTTSRSEPFGASKRSSVIRRSSGTRTVAE